MFWKKSLQKNICTSSFIIFPLRFHFKIKIQHQIRNMFNVFINQNLYKHKLIKQYKNFTDLQQINTALNLENYRNSVFRSCSKKILNYRHCQSLSLSNVLFLVWNMCGACVHDSQTQRLWNSTAHNFIKGFSWIRRQLLILSLRTL